MSMTCKHWLLPLLNAKICRYTQFHVTCHTISHKLGTPESVIKALRYLTVDFSGHIDLVARSRPKIVEFLTSLKTVGNNSLECLSFVDSLHWFDMASLPLVTSVITSQNQLKTLRLRVLDIHTKTDFITVVLTAVSQNCGDKLEQLEVRVKLFMLYTMLELPKVLSRLTRLSELSISCFFLSGEMLSNLPATLRFIKIWSSKDFYSEFKTAPMSLAWANLATKVPTLKVEFHFSEVESDHSKLRKLLHEVPLTSFYWKSVKSPTEGKQKLTDSCIQYIIDTFQNLLELHITVGFDLFNEERVATTVERFRQLETLTICQTLDNKQFDLQRLEQALLDMLDRDLVRGLIKTNITVTNLYKSRTDVFTVRDWVCVLDSQAH